MTRLAYVLSPLILMAMASCQQPTATSAADADKNTTPAAPTAPATTSQPDADAVPAGVTMRYTCEQGHRVDIVGGDTARVTLSDGRTIDIPRVADSAPPRYSGIALSFEVGADGAMLGQDEVGGFACREAD